MGWDGRGGEDILRERGVKWKGELDWLGKAGRERWRYGDVGRRVSEWKPEGRVKLRTEDWRW